MSSLSSTIFYQSKKTSIVAKLSLIALMDIFTILVFFLLLNSGDAEKIQNAKFVSLPDSSVGTSPHKEVSIIVEKDQLWFETSLVGDIETLSQASTSRVIPELSLILAAYVEDKGELSAFEDHAGLSVTILGEKTTSYALIKRIMETCQENNIRNISLAVNQVVQGVYEFEPAQAPLASSSSGGVN